MPRRRWAGIPLMTVGAVLVGLVSGGVTAAAAPAAVEQSVVLTGATAPLVSPTDRGDRDDYWRSFRRGYQLGFRDGVRAAREACRWKRDRYRGNHRFDRDRGFAAGYDRGFNNGFDRTFRWVCHYRH